MIERRSVQKEYLWKTSHTSIWTRTLIYFIMMPYHQLALDRITLKDKLYHLLFTFH
jgi:hypothetical protein